MRLNSDARPEFVSNLLPAVDGAYSISDDSERWIEALFYYLNDLSGMDALTRVGSRLPSDDPDNPGEAAPHLDLVSLPGLGVADEFRICTDPSDFVFTLKRRVAGAGSWENLLRIETGLSPIQWQVGASFMPTETNAYDFGADSLRFRDVYLYRYLSFYGFTTLPTPSIQTTRRITVNSPVGGAEELDFCRKRTAGDYKWKNVTDSFESLAILKDVAGITKATLGQTAVEILGVAHRTRVDLTYMDRCRVVFGGQNSEATTFYCKIQYSTDGSTWYDLTPEASSDGSADEQFVVGSWGNVPTGALDDVYVRAVGRAANDTSSPTFKSIELQVR